MKTTFLIMLCKLVSKIGLLLGKRASAFPGKLAYDLDINILSKVNYPKYVICVTGSSGKGSTVELINHILENAGYDVACNKSGSNNIYGITTLILNNVTTFRKKPKKEILLIESDERHLGLAFLKPIVTHLVVTNITRDQPARNNSPELVYNAIFTTIKNYTHLIINIDDPLVNRITTTYKDKITTYGINKMPSSYELNDNNSVDHAYCPICHKKLIYDYYHYGHIGNYHCPNKDYMRNKPDFVGDNVNLDKKTMTINGTHIEINKNIMYAAYATLAAYSLCKTIGIDEKVILHSLNEDKIIPKRANIYNFYDRHINMLESKNENALSYYQSLKYIVDQKGKKTIILGFDNVSRRYLFNDLAWLYDVNFEKLNNKDIDKIICIGRFKYDVATRLEYAGISKDKLILIEDLNNLLNITKEKTKGDIFTMVCFDMTEVIKNLLKGVNNEN